MDNRVEMSSHAMFPTIEDFEEMKAGTLYMRHAGLDLHDLVKLKGHEAIAEDCATGERSLKAWLCGQNPPSFDSLYRLACIHPDFSVVKTVLRIGYMREIKGVDRRTLEYKPMGFAAMRPGQASECARVALRKREENRRRTDNG